MVYSETGYASIDMLVRAEKAFGITISDAEAEAIRTPRQFIDMICSKIDPAPDSDCPTQRAFHQLHGLFDHKWKSSIDLTSNLHHTCVANALNERHVWQDIQSLFPRLKSFAHKRPFWLAVLIWVIAISATVIIGLNLTPFFGFVAWLGILAGLYALTRNIAQKIPVQMHSVKSLVRYVVSTNPYNHDISRSSVTEVVKAIVIDIMAIPENKYRLDADFINDLNLED